MSGSVKKFGAIPPGLFRGHNVAGYTHDSVRRKKPGSIYLAFSPLPGGRILGQERA